MLKSYHSARDLIPDLDSQFERRLEAAVFRYKPIIEAHPDRFLWQIGYEGGEPFKIEQPVLDRLVRFTRAFLGRLDPQVAAKVAYKNAERFLSMLMAP